MPKTTEISTITNTYFAALGDKAKVKIAGVIKKIDDKETSSGTAKRFKGDIALQNGDEVFISRYGFFPTAIRDSLIDGLRKLGKWTSAEFVLTAVKTKNEEENKWTVTYSVNPRLEQPRVMSLLNS